MADESSEYDLRCQLLLDYSFFQWHRRLKRGRVSNGIGG